MVEYRVKGALFENTKDSGPAFTGFVEIDGQKTMLALWPKTSAQGQNYLQVSEDKKRAAPAGGTVPPTKSPFAPRKPVVPKKDDDPFDDGDNIPF